MAAGRHGGYRGNEFRDRESEFVMSRKEIKYSKHEYERIRNGNHRDYERGRGRGRDSMEYRGVVREKIIQEREVVNSVYRSSSSRNDTGGGSVGPRRSEFAVSTTNGADGIVKSESQEVKKVERKMENGNQSSPAHSKKRKFSPITWEDRENRETKRIVKNRASTETVDKPLPSPQVDIQSIISNHAPAANGQISKSGECELHTSEASLSKLDVLPESPADTSSRVMQSGVEPQIERNDGVPTQRIASSRWSNDADSPADEGEISDYEDILTLKRESSFESEEVRRRISASPEPGEIESEGSRGTRGRSTRSDERARSSSRDSIANHDRNDCMKIDDDHSYDATVGQSDSEAEDDCSSHSTPERADPPQRIVNMRQGCRNVAEFEWLNKIDEGTYGIVSRARDKKTGKIVALKKVKMEKEREGFPLTALREMNILLSCHHPYIVDVKEVVVGSSLDEIYMVMEYMEHDLKALMETMKQPFSQSEVKCLMLQLLEGIKYLHDNWVLHRDLKTSNLLMNNRGELKICDFGMARQYGSPLKPYTQLVVTLWYRAPELLLGAKQYSTAVDMWSLGCIMAELLSKEPLFNGKTEIEQLDKIFKVLGTPNETIWPGCSKLPGHKVNFVKHKYNMLRKKFPATSFIGAPVLSDAGFDLLSKLLTYDPDKRITAEAALNHAWFREVPLPKSKEFMPTFPAQHDQDRVMRRIVRSPDPLEEQRRKELRQGDLGSTGLFGL